MTGDRQRLREGVNDGSARVRDTGYWPQDNITINYMDSAVAVGTELCEQCG